MGRRDRHLQEDLKRAAFSRGHLAGLSCALLLAAGCSLNPPLKLAAVPGFEAAVELTDVPFHPQRAHHCGPASLLTVLEASGVEVEYQAVADRVYVPGLEGSLQPEMTAGARHFGRVAYALPAQPAAVLAQVAAGRPVLVLLNLGLPARPYWHYAVVVGFDPVSNRVVMRSGTERRLTQKAPVWLRQWDWAGRWAIAVLRPDEWPAEPDRLRLLGALADFEDAAPPAAAAMAWRNALEHWPDEPSAWLGLGNTSISQAAWPEAEHAYRRALALVPEYLPARLNLSSLLLEIGRPCAGLHELGDQPPAAQHPLYPVFSSLQEDLRAACSSAAAPGPETAGGDETSR